MENFTEKVGAAALIGGLFLLGPVGLVALLIIAYAMAVSNLALGIVVGMVFVTPLILFTVWSFSLGYEMLNKWAKPGIPVHERV